jgi:ABC-2 type transport system permease protein
MRFLSIFRKSMREQLRDITVLGLTLIFAPLFVYLYWLFFPSGSTTYGVLVINSDEGFKLSDGSHFDAAQDVIEAINHVTYADGSPLLRVKFVEDRLQAEALLRDREATVFIDIPEDFSSTLLAVQNGSSPSPTSIIFGGDLTNPYYAVAAILTTSAVDAYIQEATGHVSPIQYVEEPLGASAARTEFETYMPGILIFAAIMLIFTASMTVVREVEAGTLRRLQISRMKAWELLGGITASLIVVGVVAVLLTFLTAIALGFRSQGPVWVAILIGALTSVSIIGAGMVVAGFSNSVSRAFVIANFPLGLFMFFSGVIYPIPKVTLFSLFGRTVGLYDVLPATHAVVALNKILNLGAGVGEVLYELGALLILSILYFAVGVWIFQRRHMRAL